MKKKMLAGMAVSAMTVGLLAGTIVTPASENAVEYNGNDISEHVDLTMYLVGDVPDHYDQITEKLNELTERDLNCSVNIEWLSWAEHSTKYSLLFSGGEDFDLIFTASSWCHYEQTASMGGFLEITDEYKEKYLPNISSELPQTAWDQALIDGKDYMVPANFIEVNPDSIAIRGDVLEKCGFKADGSDLTTWDDLMKFYEKCTEIGQYANAVGSTNLYYEWIYSLGYSPMGGAPSSGELVLRNTKETDDNSIYYVLDMEEFRDMCKKMKELADAGAWPKDVLGSTTDAQDTLLNGTGASMFWNIGTCQIYANQANAEHPDWNVTLLNIMPEEYGYGATKYINSGLGINAFSENPERAAMLIDYMTTSKEVMDLTSLGIEGQDWEAVDDETYKSLNGGWTPSNWWGWRNMNYMRDEQEENPTDVDKLENEMVEKFMANIRPDVTLDGFTFDSTKVSTQFAAVEAAMGTYWHPLLNGLVDDVDATIDQFKSALDSAGMQDILTEMQKQIDDYTAK